MTCFSLCGLYYINLSSINVINYSNSYESLHSFMKLVKYYIKKEETNELALILSRID